MIPAFCLLALLVVGLFVLVYVRARRDGAVTPAQFFFRWRNRWGVLLVAFGPLVLCGALGVLSVLLGYNGECAGPPDISFPCTYPEFLNYSLAPDQSWNIIGYMVCCVGGSLWVLMVFGLAALFALEKRKV